MNSNQKQNVLFKSSFIGCAFVIASGFVLPAVLLAEAPKHSEDVPREATHNNNLIQFYSRIIANNKGQEKAGLHARKKIVPLLLEQEPANLVLIEQYLSFLRGKGVPWDSGLWNASFRLLLRKVQIADKNTKFKVWQTGIRKLAQKNIVLSQNSQRELEAFVASLENNKDLAGEKVIQDVLLLNVDVQGHTLLTNWSNVRRLKKRLFDLKLHDKHKDNRSKDFCKISKIRQKTMLIANVPTAKESRGYFIRVYSQIIAGCDEQDEAGLHARKKIIPLLLAQEPANLVLIEQHLSFLRNKGVSWDSGLWNASFRLLLRKVQIADKNTKFEVWQTGIRKLAQENIVLGQNSQKELEAFVASLENNKELAGGKVIQDVLSLNVDVQSHTLLTNWLNVRRLKRGLFDLKLHDKHKNHSLKDIRNNSNIYTKGLPAIDVAAGKGSRGYFIRVYSQIIARSKEDDEAGLHARKKIVPLLLAQEPANLVLIEQYLSFLRDKGVPWDSELWNASFRLLLRKVTSADGKTGFKVWQTGIRKLAQKNIMVSRDSLKELEAFIASLKQDEELTEKNIIQDVLSLHVDVHSRVQLANWLEVPRLNRGLFDLKKQNIYEDHTSKEIRRMMLKAQVEEAKRNFAEAASVFTEIVEKYPQNKAVTRIARRRLIGLLLELGSEDLDQIDRHLHSLLEEQAEPDQELWNWECRTLFRRILSVPPKERAVVWEKGIADLQGSKVTFSQDSLADLDILVQSLQEDGELPAIKVLTDLFLLIPCLDSLHQLQSRRVGLFVRDRKWKEAISAQAFNLLLTTTGEDGLIREITQYIRVLESADRPSPPEEDVVRSLWTIPSAIQSVSATSAPADWRSNRFVDNPLRLAAVQKLRQRDRTLPLRSKALLCSLAGKTQQALRDIHAVLWRTTAGVKEISDVFWETSLILSLGNQRIQNMHPLLTRLHETYQTGGAINMKTPDDPQIALLLKCEQEMCKEASHSEGNGLAPKTKTYGRLTDKSRSDVLNEVRSRFDNHVFQWGCRAFDAGKTGMAMEFWTHILEQKNADSRAISLVDSIADYAKRAKGGASAQEVLKILSSRIQSPAPRRHMMTRRATFLYEEGRFRDVLSILETVEQEEVTPEQRQNMAMGFLRAMSLIRLNELNQAAATLKEMEAWSGEAEQHARVAFLLGWIKLQQNDRANALLLFRRVMDQYANTPFAPKARDMVGRLEGI